MSSRYLAIDTSTEACSAALSIDGAVSERFEVAGREHSQKLLPMVQSLFAEAGINAASIDAIACGIGPGSFAGVRVGVGVAKGLALAYDRPVAGVSSLAMLALDALDALDGDGTKQAAAVIDARMQEVYCGLYRYGETGGVESVQAECVCAPEAVPRLGGGDWVGVGTGWGSYGQILRQAFGIPDMPADGAALPSARAALALALPRLASGQGMSADELAPVYLRDRVALTLSEQQSRRR